VLLTPARIQRLLRAVRHQRVSVREAYQRLQRLPFDDLGFAKLDTHRALRRRLPEVVFCEGKRLEHLIPIVQRLQMVASPLLLTRVSPEQFAALHRRFPPLIYYPTARLAAWPRRNHRPASRRCVLIVTAGTADLPVAEEARFTLEVLGRRVRLLSDVGVAGLHRLTEHLSLIQRAAVIIVVAGMEGALASVVGGLAAAPVIAVPTSVGYGASFRGVGALLTMLNTCVPGVVVVNIDNGFGAAYFASLLLDGTLKR